MRMASTDRFFIIAPNDKRMKTLINIAKNLKEEVYMGTLFKMDMDLGAYIGAVVSMAGGRLNEKGSPETGKMYFFADAENGRISTSSTIRVSDVRELVNYSQQLASLSKRSPKVILTALPNPQKNIRHKAAENADYWAERGSLCATYGNDKAAIKFYQKALTLDPQRSDVYFHLGISYGETGEFENALDALNKAISLDPKKAVYYYGRGRVYLKFGKKDLAQEDFKFAADNGNKDAKAYLGIKDEMQ